MNSVSRARIVSRDSISFTYSRCGAPRVTLTLTFAPRFDAASQGMMTRVMNRETGRMRGKFDARSLHGTQAPLTQVDLRGSRRGEQRDWDQHRDLLSTRIVNGAIKDWYQSKSPCNAVNMKVSFSLADWARV
jgi:hypothetical protein